MRNYKIIIFLLISLFINYGCSLVKGENWKALCINLYNEKDITISIKDEINMTHASGYLLLVDGDVSYEIPVDIIKKFYIVNDYADVKNISPDKEHSWTIYDMNGRLMVKGKGQLPIDKLIKGHSYIVIKDGISLKIHIN